jgi:integrase
VTIVRASTALACPQLRAAEIARKYGFTTRHWIRPAATGKIPGVRQPSGPRGCWLFDAALFAKWLDERARKVESWPRYTAEEKYTGRANRQNREHRRSLKTADRAIAEKRLRARLDELDAIAWGDKPRHSYAEAEEKFVREHLTILKPKAALRYGVSLKHLSEHFGCKMLHEITSAELSEFETKRRTQGVRAGTIRRDFACLSSLLTSCVDWEWLDGNIVPAYLKRRAKRGLREAPPRTRYLTIDEEQRLITAASPANMRNKNGHQAGKWTSCREAIILNIDTGLRREELFSLRWSQIDLDRGVIVTTTLTKNGRSRMVPLPERSRTILGTVPRRLDTDYVFVNPSTGTRFVTMDNGMRGAMRRAKIKDFHWHDLRRTAGCRWLQRDGKTMAEVSLLLGHSSVKVTEDRYAFLEAEIVAQSLSGRTKVGTGLTDSGMIVEHKQDVA